MKSFKQIWVSLEPDEKQALADSCGTKKNYLSQIAGKKRYPSGKLMRALCEHDPRLHMEMFL